MYITYDIKNGVKYGKAVTSKRDGGKIQKAYINLGRVVDADRLIFQNRKQGVFVFDPKDGSCSKADAAMILPSGNGRSREKLILDFGDSFFLDAFLRKVGLNKSVDTITYGNRDTLYAMLFYYVLCHMSNSHAEEWWEGNYVRVLFPQANLTSQRISDFLAEVGKEKHMREFFGEYIRFLAGKGTDNAGILIDSTGLPNAIHFPLTAISNHNGKISNEVRLIYVIQQSTGLPIYFRYCPGNVVDVSTIIRTVSELKANGVNTKFAIMDAGYYTENNVRELFRAHISFISRLRENLSLYKELLAKYLPEIECAENLVEYNGRYVYIKRVPCDLYDGCSAYAYVCLDILRKASEMRKLFDKAKLSNMDTTEVFHKMEKQGAFVLVSSRPIAACKILPLYYTRQQIEQIFDIGKNYADMMPLRVQGEDTFRGHLLLTFVATVILKMLQDKLLRTQHNPCSALLNLKNQKCKLYDDVIVTQEAFKKANDIYKLFAINCPAEIPFP